MYFVRGLIGAGYQLQLITQGDGVLPPQDEYEGASMRRVPLQTDGNFLTQAIAFGQAVMAHVGSSPCYDLVHYRSIWSGLALAQSKNKFGFKTLFEVNGLPSVELKYHYPGLRESGLLAKIREQELATLALSDAIVCPSAVTRAYLASLGVPRERITVIHNGVSPKDFAPTLLPPRDDHIPVLLYVGTYADWQGLETLIAAMPRVLAQQPARLRIVGRGRGRQRKMLAKQIRKLGLDGHVMLEPAVPHHLVPEIIASADVCIAPLSLNDRNVTQGCCPIKVIECMAAGRPLVAANLPVVRELAREDIDALFFAPNDPDDLAHQLLSILTDRALGERLAASAAARASGELTWHEAQKKLLSVYARLLKE